MQETTIAAIRDHAQRDYPRESCGVVIVYRGKERYIPCRNVAEQHNHFEMHHEDYANAEDQGEIICIVHSHPNESPKPSPADLVSCEQTGVPWLIVNWPTGMIHEFAPSGYKAPLIGRAYHHGVLDCYSLIQDYYKEVLALPLPDIPRADYWWLKGQTLYADHYRRAGFEMVSGPLQLHDVVMMQIASPHTENHAAVYVGDGCILQHLMGRMSSRDVYGGYYQKCTTKIIRHRSLLDA